ncbi:hypothetical protein [Amycolatopsis sp. NPDC059657]|uniref:hypothetical protein n=1 Tax=Amycolatopsis sp. NPDC059657 TaxID=3346899 RepID=UPI00366E6948
MESDELLVLRQRPEWRAAVGRLQNLADEFGNEARTAAHKYAAEYAKRRGSMVIDVVASRQRRYVERVLPMVKRWEADHQPATLEVLAETPPDAATYGLLPSEPVTMQTIARNLTQLIRDLRTDEDTGCRIWADSVQVLEHAHRLDPVVGAVPGIGPALFAYLRMRCGADALKPDLRVAKALRGLGFTVPGDTHSIMVLARAAAAEIDFPLLSLDQLLWNSQD